MSQIARCDWLPERARWLWEGKIEPSCPLGTTAVSHKKNFPESHIINPLLTKFVQSRWLDIGLVLFLRLYGPRLNTQKKNLTNIQPSWLHTWSITHIYWPRYIHVRFTSGTMFCLTNPDKHWQCHLQYKALQKLSGFLARNSGNKIKIHPVLYCENKKHIQFCIARTKNKSGVHVTVDRYSLFTALLWKVHRKI